MVDGRVAAMGHPSEVVNRYVGLVLERQEQPAAERDRRRAGSFRHGDGASRVIVALTCWMRTAHRRAIFNRENR